MNDRLYIVWVGGVAEHEGYNRYEAELVFRLWQRRGYDDAHIEIVTKVIA